MKPALLERRTGSSGLNDFRGRESPVDVLRKAASGITFGKRAPYTDQLSQDAAPEARMLSRILKFSLSNGGNANKNPEKIRLGLQQFLLDEPTMQTDKFLGLVKEACRIKNVGGKYMEAAQIVQAFNIDPAELIQPPELQ